MFRIFEQIMYKLLVNGALWSVWIWPVRLLSWTVRYELEFFLSFVCKRLPPSCLSLWTKTNVPRKPRVTTSNAICSTMLEMMKSARKCRPMLLRCRLVLGIGCLKSAWLTNLVHRRLHDCCNLGWQKRCPIAPNTMTDQAYGPISCESESSYCYHQILGLLDSPSLVNKASRQWWIL